MTDFAPTHWDANKRKKVVLVKTFWSIYGHGAIVRDASGYEYGCKVWHLQRLHAVPAQDSDARDERDTQLDALI